MTSKGFTLAEVLITLGIIGVVAALAIPTLISNNNKRIVETRLAKFYSSINQAIELSEVENGPKEKWDVIPNSQDGIETWFNKYLEPYLAYRTTKINIWNEITVDLNDGSSFRFGSGGCMFYPRSVTNNSIEGKDSFEFMFAPAGNGVNPISQYKYHVGKGMEPYQWNWDGTEESLRAGTYGCSITGNKHYCTQLIRQNGWKIPDDYPIKF